MKRWLELLPTAPLLCVLLTAGCRTVTPPSSQADAADEAASEMRMRAHAHYSTAVIYDINDEPEQAMEEYFQAAIYDPENESLTLEISRRLIIARQPDRALELLQSSASRPDASGEIFGRLGLVYAQVGRSAEAIDANRTAIKKSPKSLAGYKNLFQDYLSANKSDEALKVLDEAGRQKDADLEFLIGLAELYAQYLNQYPSKRADIESKAIPVLDRAAQLSPDTSVLRLRLADGYVAMGDTTKAAKFYEASLGAVSEIPILRDTIREKLVEIYLRGGSNRQAVVLLEDTIRDDPSNARAYYLLGAVAVDEKRWADAAGFLDKAVLFNPGFERAYYDLASACIAAGQSGKALAILNEARKKFPQNFLMEYLLGSAFAEEKAYSQALQHLTTAEVIAKASEPKRLVESFYFQLGVVCERSGDFALAAKYFQKAIDLSPEFAAALNYLGYMWAERGENLEQAEQLIERALNVEPDSEAYLDSMGWVRFKRGDTKSALKYILKAIEVSEEPDAELYNHLGDVYVAMNEPDKACEAWRKALSIEPADEIQKKLEATESK